MILSVACNHPGPARSTPSSRTREALFSGPMVSHRTRGTFFLASAGALALASCVGMSTPTGTTTQGLYGEMEENENRLGNDYSSFDLEAADPQLCQTACEKDTKCRAFTYVKPGWQGPAAKCWLKDVVPPIQPHECCTSGAKP